jgi:hypothetical protein
MEVLDSAGKKNGPRRSRTCDPLIKRPGVRAYDGPALAGIAW